jgi:peptide/nickel transport system ATP-binding protein
MSGVQIQGLTVRGPQGVVVEPFDATIAAGRTLAIIGESGSGKTLSAKSLIGLLPRGFRAGGTAVVADTTIPLDAPPSAWVSVRGGTVALLLQDPFTSLSPVHRCGDQIAWTLRAASDRRMPPAEVAREVAARLAEVKLPERVARSYPHQLSGGMRQRVAIAAALAADPRLLIADEPTTALDASNQAEILDLLRAVQARRDLSVILISHDLGLVRGRSDDVLVMQHGVIVERGATNTVLSAPQHPYTRALIDADPVLAPPRETVVPEEAQTATLVLARGVTKHFGERTVLDGVDLRIGEGEIVGVVGESGSGKSTLARCIAGLEREDAGTISFDGDTLAPGRRSRTPAQMQIVFQDPYSSLNPMMSIGAILREALTVARRPASDVAQLLETVGLPAGFAAKRPAELSGGQRQRVAIARALAPRPRLLICDESVSALDVSVQAQILALLTRLRDELGISLLFISHDLAVVRLLADTVTVLWDGRVIESGPCDRVLTDPHHEYTRMLVAAAHRENTSVRAGDRED